MTAIASHPEPPGAPREAGAGGPPRARRVGGVKKIREFAFRRRFAA